MDADDVLTGGRRRADESNCSDDVLFRVKPRPLTKQECEEAFNAKPSLPKINPMPFVKIVDVPKRKSRKMGKGIMIGFNLSF